VSLHFTEPVEGPVILGAGRHAGMGLFYPSSLANS
jgi:CRISPR-associated protein Csb2